MSRQPPEFTRSDTLCPYTTLFRSEVLDAGDGSEMGSVTPLELARLFPTTELADIGDELADGLFGGDPAAPQPLALFDALRTDFSLARLRHYTRSEEHTSELQSLMRISYAVFCLKKKKTQQLNPNITVTK